MFTLPRTSVSIQTHGNEASSAQTGASETAIQNRAFFHRVVCLLFNHGNRKLLTIHYRASVWPLDWVAPVFMVRGINNKQSQRLTSEASNPTLRAFYLDSSNTAFVLDRRVLEKISLATAQGNTELVEVCAV